jgi:hypothetical protein
VSKNEPCIAGAIWHRCRPAPGAFMTAQARHAMDEALRAELAQVEPRGLREHAAEMIRGWRDEFIGRRDACAHQRLAELEARVAALEARSPAE